VPASSAPKPGDKKATTDGDWRSVKVLCNKELHSPISDRSARHIELDVKVYSTRHSSHKRTRTRATAHALVWPNDCSAVVKQSVDGGDELKYECGDHVAVMPLNDPDLVERLAKRLKVDPDAWFTFEKGPVSVPFETPCTVRRALGQVLTPALFAKQSTATHYTRVVCVVLCAACVVCRSWT
jgi:sulfite reductase alpha subunit-like flavoprotein